MWYIMQADDDARIIVGFKENRMPVSFRKSRKQNLTFYSGRYKSEIR
jgi:hypothetical protein